uniref:Protein OSCP1-like n=1 Tax=Phallusia mammillata TaxID=59560 RepID=A0A6F9DNN0_9ASCI|nr:protein OSCP1-like [Phallusia mammillata]
MAQNVMPILFYNLGGEMLYVIEQRLRAQKIERDKASKVISDIVCTMFKPQFLQEIIKPQPVYSHEAMNTMFRRLVHTSIMKVNDDSMEKLYDLMIMAVKYQFSQCPHPRTLLCITFNHFDSILEFVAGHNNAVAMIKQTFNLFVQEYSSLSDGEFILIRQSLLGFLQDFNNKVSIYLHEKVQNDMGKFVVHTSGEIPYGADVPGTIKIFRGKEIESISFRSGGNYQPSKKILHTSYSIGGTRSTKLGRNMYANDSVDCLITHNGRNDKIELNAHAIAKAELGLLAKLIGSEAPKKNTEFRLQLFSGSKPPSTPKVVTEAVPAKQNVLDIKASTMGNEKLSKIVDDLTISPSNPSTSRGEDLLSLMDL